MMDSQSTRKTYVVYILECENGHYYTGYTDNLTKRFQAHCDGTSRCKYTRAFKPIRIAQSWSVPDKSQAMRFEYAIKQLSRQEKEIIIKNPERFPYATT